MEKITEYTKNLNINYNFIQEDGKSSSCGTGKCFMNKLKNNWVNNCERFYHELELHGHDHYRAIGSALYSHIKSCEYTDEKLKDLNTENQEFKSLIYGMLDEINELKEHNKCLSERIHNLENKPPMILIN